MKAKRANFSDQSKAAIFARDRAMCCYSGKSLWLLDYGAAPALGDQVDHIVPASKGGRNDDENGVLCSFMHNYLRRNNGRPLPLFDNGLPNLDAFWIFDRIPSHIVDHIVRFKNLHYSDWYVNRAVAGMRFAAAQAAAPKRRDGKNFARGVQYHCKAALSRLEQWRSIVEMEGLHDLKTRNLLPVVTGPDHHILLAGLGAKTTAELEALVVEFEPFVTASYNAVEGMFSLENEVELREYMSRIASDPRVVAFTKNAVVEYMERVLREML